MIFTNPYIHTYYVNLHDGAEVRRERHPLSSGDKNADVFVVHLQNCGREVNLEGVTAIGKVVRSDGRTVMLNGVVSDSAVKITLDENCYAVPGEIQLTISVVLGDMVRTVMVVTMNLLTSETNAVIDNGVIVTLAELVAEIDTMREATTAANEAAEAANAARGWIADSVRSPANDNVIADSIVPYWGDSGELAVEESYPARRVGVSRHGGTITLTGRTYGTNIRITMSGNLTRTATNESFNQLERTLDLADGHQYEIEIRKLRGTYEGTDIRCLVYPDSSTSAVGSAVLDDATGRGIGRFTWSGGKAIVAYRLLDGMTFEDLELCCVITDLTEEMDRTIVRLLMQGITDIRQELQSGLDKKLGYVKTLAGDDDLDTFGNGVYRVAGSELPAGSPTDKSFVLLQYGVNDTTYGAVQIVITSSGQIVTRYRSSSGWGEWHQMVKQTDLDSVIGAQQEEISKKLGYVKTLTWEDDLDSINNGAYRASSSDLPLNSPAEMSFVLLQYGVNNSTYGAAQIAITSRAQLYTRYRSSNGWGQWVQGGGESVDVSNVYADMYAEALDLDWQFGGIESVDGGESDSGHRVRTDWINSRYLRVEADPSIEHVWYFYADNVEDAYIGTSGGWISGTSTSAEYAPDGAMYTRVLFRRADNEVINDLAEVSDMVEITALTGSVTDPYADYIPDVPESKGVLNAIRNFKQLTDVQYTPLAAIPQQQGDFPAGVQQTGLPYSSSRPEAGFVPNFVSMYTFLSAVRNPNSYLYTVDLGDLGNINGDTYYGAVCSTACGHALGIVPNYSTSQWGEVPGMDALENQSANALMLGDTICGNGHIVMVTDITRNSRGDIGRITISEADGERVRQKKYTLQGIKNRFDPASGWTYYRYSKIHAVEHVQSPYVAVEDEVPQAVTWNETLIPRKGDKSNWLVGVPVEIDVLDVGSYTNIVIYKDDVAYQVLGASAQVTLTDLPSGSYKAQLTDGETSSDWCYWMVVDAAATAAVTGNPGEIKVDFSASNAEPLWVNWVAGTSLGSMRISIPTDEELAAGSAVCAYKEGNYRIRVAFRTEYGIIHSELTDVLAVTGTPEAPEKTDGFEVGSGLLMKDGVLSAEVTKTDIEEIHEMISQGGGSAEETDPTVPARISEHNTSEDAHNDIRLLLAELSERLGAIADSDDTTLDQLSEIVAYIKSNKSLIDGITTGKISTSDIVDNLTTNVATKPLSAAQGVALKALVDAITVPTKVSQLEDDVGIATQEDVAELSAEIDAITVPTKVSELENDAGYIDENTLTEELAKRGQLKPEFANSVEECTDTSKLYVLPDGYIYAYIATATEGETVPNFTNLLDDPNAYVKNGYRYSHSSQAFKEQASDCAIVVPVPTEKPYTIRVRGATMNGCNYPRSVYLSNDNSVFTATLADSSESGFSYGDDENGDAKLVVSGLPSTQYSYIVFHVAHVSDENALIVTINEEITYTTTEGSIEYRWASTGHAFVPADYEDRIVDLEAGLATAMGDIEALQDKVSGVSMSTNATTAFSVPAYCPVPQLPADGSEEADFDYKSVTTQDAYDYMDALCSKYTQYITKQTMGKDASGAFDHNRYILSKAYWRAWQKENYPRMFAWINGSTVIYSVSVSPRVGDTMYTTPYIGTAYSTVTAVNSAAKTASTRTVNGLVFTRHESGDVEPTIVYTKPYRYPGDFATATVYNSSYGSLTTVSTVGDDYIIGADGNKYARYPFEDRRQDKTKPLSVFILSNEHGLNGDALIPSFAVMRMAKDLCKNTDNPFLKWLKENCMITMIPVGNPWGYARYLATDGNTSGYYNVNGVNINRNYDTPGWSTSDTNYGDTETFGTYPGCEVETQHIMNTMRHCKPAVGISMHGLGLPTEYADMPDNGYFIYQGQGFDSARVHKIAETLFSAYGLGPGASTDYAQHYEMCGKSPAYIQYTGAVGGLTETIEWEAGTSNKYTSTAMEQAYTQLLLFLQNWCEEALLKASE